MRDFLLFGTRDAVQCERREEQQKAVRAVLPFRVLGRCFSQLEHSDARSDDHHTNVVTQRVLLATDEHAHEHDGDHLAGLAQRLSGETHVLQSLVTAQHRTQVGRSREGERSQWHASAFRFPDESSGISYQRVSDTLHEKHEESGCELVAAGRSVREDLLLEDAIAEVARVDAGDADEQVEDARVARTRRVQHCTPHGSKTI